MEKKNGSKAYWWEGARGESYVVVQVTLLMLVFFGPRAYPGWPTWSSPFKGLATIGGIASLLAGVLLFTAAIFRLGRNLTPVPYPMENGTLVETGPYRYIRHPIYGGLLLIAFGWAFLVHGWLTLGYAIILLVFFDLKSRREEEWLKVKFPGYEEYQKRVRKLIPFVY